MPNTILAELLHLMRRRWLTLLLLGLVTVFALLSQRVFHIFMPAAHSASLIGAVVLVAWIAIARLRTVAVNHALDLERDAVVRARRSFRDTVVAFVLPTSPDDEPEAEALREGLVRRHAAILASRRAMLEGRPPEADDAVVAATSPHERADNTELALLDRLASLQREALGAAQRLGLLGEQRTIRLDEHLQTLTRPPSRPPKTTVAPLAVFTSVFALVLPLVSAQRMTTALVAALGSLILIAFESWATSEVDRRAE